MSLRTLTPDGIFCSSCGNPVEPEDQLCVSCGQPFEGDVPGTKCPQCGRALDEREVRCPACGTTLPPPGESPRGKDLIEEIKSFRESAREDAIALEQLAAPLSEETEAGLLAELESLWKLSEPFEQVMTTRRKRLEQMDRLIAAARRRVRDLEESETASEVKEREELKGQVQEVLMERDQILKIEYGIAEMERIYRNIITTQQKELRAKTEALRGRLEGFRKEIARRDAERETVLKRERELDRRERALESRLKELETRIQTAEPPAAPAPAEPAILEAPEGVTPEQWMAAQREMQEALLQLRGAPGELVLPTAANVRDLRLRVAELEEAMEKVSEVKGGLESELTSLRAAQDHVRDVLRVVDDLLGKLPEEEIERFARSEEFKKYGKLLEHLGL